MKKIFMSIIAVATLTMAMTSCSKDESSKPGDLPFTFENPEVLDQVKTHFEGFNQFWDEGDVISVVDGSKHNKALYEATVNSDGSAHFVFKQQVKGNTIDLTGVIEGVYPASIASKYGYVCLPSRQYSVDGEVNEFPLYANGPMESFTWRNLCGWVAFDLTGNVDIDSISITTDKYLNGTFSVNIANLDNPLTYAGVSGHGTKTSTVRYANSIHLTGISKRLLMYVPAGTYNSFTITFYSGNTKYVKRNQGTTTISRSYSSAATLTLNNTNFVPFINGAIAAQYNVAGEGETAHNVIFSQGNLEYTTNNFQYWRFADNQWGYRGNAGTSTSRDRDVFAWGANGYYIAGHYVAGYGNNIQIWGKTAPYYYDGTTLSGANEWGNNMIANGGYSLNSGWRTLTATEMTNLLNNYENHMVTLSFVGKSGLLILSDAYTSDLTAEPIVDGASIAKPLWNTLEATGCVFLTAENNATYWLNTADATTASALVLGNPTPTNIQKNTKAFVRLVKDAE